MIKKSFKAGFRWREIDFPVPPTLDAPPGFQLSSFYGERPIYQPNTDPQTIPTGGNLPEWQITDAQRTAAIPWGTAPVPELQPIPPRGIRTRSKSTARAKPRSQSRARPTAPIAGPSRTDQPGPSRPLQPVVRREPSKPVPRSNQPPRRIVIRPFTPSGVPGSTRVGANMVCIF